MSPISGLLEGYIADLKAQARASQHIKDTFRRIERVFRELNWHSLSNISASGFTEWRAKLTISAKTKKEYLVSLNAFMRWLIAQGKLSTNPLAAVAKVETRGKQVRLSRPYTEEELRRLFAVAGPRAIVYKMLLYSGQRKSEVQALRWRDLHLDTQGPFASFRAATMKDKEGRAIPLPLPLAKELLALRPTDSHSDERVFFGIFPHFETFTADLRRAGIAQRDSAGHVVNLHAFRKTHGTLAAGSGVSQKVTQTVLGHSDANLTANIYSEIPTSALFSELKRLPWITDSAVENDLENRARNCARISGAEGQTASFPDKTGKGEDRSKYVDSPLKRRVLAALDTLRQNLEMVDATGLEPVANILEALVKTASSKSSK